MANLSRHPSLRFSVFEVAADLGLETHVLDGNFNPIIEENEEEAPSPTQANARQHQRQTHSSDELTDSPYPLTPPSSNDALFYSTRPLLLNKKIEEKPRFIERFPSPSIPLNAPQRPTTPRTNSGKLRKAQAPPASSPPLELRLDFSTDIELNNRRPRERKKSLPEEQKVREKSPGTAHGAKKAKDRSHYVHENSTQPSPLSTPDDEEKGLLGGLLRFRTRSKERKAAAKQAMQQIGEHRTMTPPVRLQTPPPLPIAERFARSREADVSFRPPQVQESGSSHGGGTSVGHTTSVGHQSATSQGSADTHEVVVYPRPRDRSSRYERPHPVWRSGPASTVGKHPTISPAEAVATLPAERHAYPPNQTIFDREPAKPLRVNTNGSPTTPGVDMDAINKYYGITPAANVPSAPSPQSRFALTQALTSPELKTPESPATPRQSPATMAPPASPSPFIVPSPDPTQVDFGVKKRAKPGRMNIPPALDPSLVSTRRKMAQFIPPPTPPPTMDLPPIPTDMVPPSSAVLRPPVSSPLATRSPSPGLNMNQNMRKGSTTLLPPPYSERQENVRPTSPVQRAASPNQRGKTPAFPARPITPTRPPPTEPLPALPRQGTNTFNRRQELDGPDMARPRRSSLNEQDLVARPRQQPSRVEQYQPPIAAAAPVRKRSFRRQTSGYDSDDTDSRYSRDTYYGRETAYFDDQNMPPLPGMPGFGMGDDVPPVPVSNKDFGNMESERKAGRERLLRFLAGREA